MDQIMAQMFKQLGAEQHAEDSGMPPPDMPDMSKLITQVTKTMLQDDSIKSLIGIPNTEAPQPKVIVHKCSVTLPELFRGAKKEIRMKRHVWNPATTTRSWEKAPISFDIQAGSRFGDEILLQGVSDSDKDSGPGDLKVVLQQSDELCLFSCTGEHDLSMNLEVDMVNMYCYRTELQHVDGHTYGLYYQGDKPLNGSFRVRDLGMPRGDGTYGDLMLNISVKLPDRGAFEREMAPERDACEGDRLIERFIPDTDE